jgi:hypothetical protein
MQLLSRWNIKAKIQAKDVCHVIVKKMSFCSGHPEVQRSNARVTGILQNIDNLETTAVRPVGTFDYSKISSR